MKEWKARQCTTFRYTIVIWNRTFFGHRWPKTYRYKNGEAVFIVKPIIHQTNNIVVNEIYQAFRKAGGNFHEFFAILENYISFYFQLNKDNSWFQYYSQQFVIYIKSIVVQKFNLNSKLKNGAYKYSLGWIHKTHIEKHIELYRDI